MFAGLLIKEKKAFEGRECVKDFRLDTVLLFPQMSKYPSRLKPAIKHTLISTDFY